MSGIQGMVKGFIGCYYLHIMANFKDILLGADHAGFALKEVLKQDLLQNGWKVRDVSPVLDPEDVKVRFDGQVWNLVEATQSLETVKKNS
jgi:hypothetical protein